MCAGVSIGFGVYAQYSGCWGYVGGHYTRFTVGTPATAFGTPSLSASATVLVSNATTAKQLSGWFKYAGGSVGFGLDLTAQASWGRDSNNNLIWEAELGASAGPPIPAEAHGGLSYTTINSQTVMLFRKLH
jgi:hypothetical protein